MNIKSFTKSASLNLSDEVLTIHIEDAIQKITPIIAFLITAYLMTRDILKDVVRRMEFTIDELKERFGVDEYQDDMNYILENCDEDEFDAQMGMYLADID
mgnify:CR=1 FL=1